MNRQSRFLREYQSFCLNAFLTQTIYDSQKHIKRCIKLALASFSQKVRIKYEPIEEKKLILE